MRKHCFGEGRLLVNRLELLGFYDEPKPGEQGMHATAINAVAGEEFGLALLIDYFSSAGTDARQLDGPCTTGKQKGHRLDGWVETPNVLYQVEVKNWSSHSFGGRRLSIDASDSEARAHRITVWNEYWDGTTFVDPPAAKVLECMSPPSGYDHVEPLIVFWVAMHPDGKADPFFEIPISGGHFDRLSVFSMSNYLRGMTCDRLELPLPKTEARLGVLDRIFGLE